MFFSANLQVVQQWLIRKQMFKSSSKVGVFHSFVTNGLKLGGGFILPTAAPLVFISAVAPGIQSFMLLTKLRVAIRMRFTAFFRFSFSSIKKVSKRYYDFPLYRAPQILINSISQSVPVFLLTAYFGPASVGFYSIGKMVLGLPSHLIGKSVSDVFYPRIAQAQRGNENISKLLFKATALMALVGLVPFGVIVAFGPWLFELVFGAEWTTAGEYARWMAIWLYFAFLNRPALSAIPVINMQKFFLAYEIASGIIRALALFVGFYWFKNDVFMVAAYSVAGVFLNLFLVVWVIIKSKQI
jgi:O-antigen/teichoic acid export membrane protein